MSLKNIYKLDVVQKRCFSLSSVDRGKRNFTKFILYNRGTKMFQKMQAENPHPDLPRYPDGVREVGYKLGKKYVVIPEMIPDVIVPDLTNFELRPYVSYRVPDVEQEEFTPKDLFHAIYYKKIMKDFETKQLDENGNSLSPSDEELLAAEEAYKNARRTGCDLFKQNVDFEKSPFIP